jgi:hypothetical protein
MARVVTGKIVEKNPKGFSVVMLEATIGVRGTILSVRSMNGKTTTYVENTARAVYVNDIDVPGGNKITVPGDAQPEAISPQDRRDLGRDLAFYGGMGVAAAAPEPFQESERPEGYPQARWQEGLRDGDMFPTTAPSLAAQDMRNSLATGMSQQASVAGTLMSNWGGTLNNSSSTCGGCPSGSVINNLSHGSGRVYPSTFSMGNFQGGSSSVLLPSVISDLMGGSTLSGTSLNPNDPIPVNYFIEFPGGTGVLDKGTGAGTFQ